MEAKPLEIRLLGEFAVFGSGGALPAPKAKKARLLVGHLVLNAGYDLHRDQLADHLWPDLDPDRALFNLRQLLAKIRREAPSLAPCIAATDRRTLTFHSEGVKIDAAEFRRLVGSSPEQAVSLYRGPLLKGLDDEWLAVPRSELEEIYLGALESMADASSAREAVRLLRRAVETDPYRETLQQKLLTRLAESGDSAGVKSAYRRFQELLHRELNAAPAEETTRLYRRLTAEQQSISAGPELPPVPRHRLPVPSTTLVGREEEIEEVCTLLATARLVSILGPGGSGKTRLAIAVGARHLTMRSGVWFVDLSSESEPARVPQTVGQVLGLREPSGTSWTDAVAEAIARTDHLLILDNCEHVLEACRQLTRSLLDRCDQARILTTSRIPLAVQGEQRFTVPPLRLPQVLTEPFESDRYSALALFEERARLVAPQFSISNSNVALVVSICREIDAMPLAIEMAAARLAALSLDEVARRLGDKIGFLRSLSQDTVPRHQTLAAVIEWSYGLLTAAARSLMARLSVFAGGWTLSAAESVCGFGQLPPDGILDALTDLVDASLVQRQADRYSLLETVRQFCLQELIRSGDESQTRERHLDYFGSTCEHVEAIIAREGRDRAALRFGSDLDNLRVALDWSLKSGEIQSGLRLIANASVVFSIVQLDGEAVAWLQKLLAEDVSNRASFERLAALTRATILYQSQYADFERSRAREDTIRACEELIELSQAVGDRQSLAEAHASLGSVRLWWDRDLAIRSLKESLDLAGTLPNGGRSQRPLRLIGQWYYDGGSFDEANSFFARAGDRARRTGDLTELLFALQAESHLLREHCRYDEALEKLLEIQRLLAENGDARASAFNDLRFAELYLDRWEFEAMAAPLDRAWRFFFETHSRLHRMLADGMIRYTAAHHGRISDSVDGVAAMVARLIADAYGNPSACWHGACIEMEALAYSLAVTGRVHDGARVFGAARSLRERDWAFLSPSVRARWDRLTRATGFDSEGSAVEAGRKIGPEAAVQLAREMERLVLD